MKKNCLAFFALLLVLSVAGSAKAVLVSVTGTLNFQVSTWNPFLGLINGGSPFTIDVNPTTGAFTLPASIYQPGGVNTIYSLPASLWPLGPVTLTGAGNAAASFGPTWVPFTGTGAHPACAAGGANMNACVPAGGFGGLMGINVVAHLYSGWPTVTAPTTGMIPILNLPLSMFGDYNNNVFSTAGPMSGWGNGWTTGVARVTSANFSNSQIATITGNFWDGSNITDVGSTINLVTSAFIRQFASANIPVVATMSITIVPEPSTALLLGAGLIGLIVAGRRK